MIGTITLNPSIDQHVLVKKLVKDDANRAVSVMSFAGGKGVNVSKVVRELGGATMAYAPVGGFAGEFWKEGVRALGIPFRVVTVRGQTRINTILTDLEDDTQTRISAPGPRISERESKTLLGRLLNARPRPFLWALGGSLPRGIKASAYRTFISALQRQGTPCVLDTDNEGLRLGIQARPFMVKPNEHEIQRLVNRRLASVEDYHRAAQTLVARGVRLVVVSLAARGALFVTEDQSFHLIPPNVAVKSNVGAGDSLIGGLALGLCRKMSLEGAARLGMAASVSAVMREAPRLCVKGDIPTLLPLVRIRSIMKTNK